MRAGPWRWIVAPILVAGVVTGCGQDRESALVGKWESSSLSAPVMAMKLKDQTPSASGSQAMGGARALTNAGMEIRKDKTFSMAWLGSAMDGTWTLDKKSGEMVLNVTKSQALAPGLPHDPSMAKGPFVAYLDPDNLRLRFYPVSRELVSTLKSSGGPMADGIALKKGD